MREPSLARASIHRLLQWMRGLICRRSLSNPPRAEARGGATKNARRPTWDDVDLEDLEGRRD